LVIAMDDDDDDEVARARRILKEARETVERTKDLGKRKPRDDAVKLPPDELAKTLIGHEDRVTRWKLEGEERERQRELAKAEIASSRCASWSDIDARIQEHLKQERTFMYGAVGEAIGQLLDKEHDEIMRAHREEIKLLKIEIAKFGSEVAELRAVLAETRASARGVDPAALARRVN
jgi:hypothetical protein